MNCARTCRFHWCVGERAQFIAPVPVVSIGAWARGCNELRPYLLFSLVRGREGAMNEIPTGVSGIFCLRVFARCREPLEV